MDELTGPADDNAIGTGTRLTDNYPTSDSTVGYRKENQKANYVHQRRVDGVRIAKIRLMNIIGEAEVTLG